MTLVDLDALPTNARRLWGEITGDETLGASRQLRLAGRLFMVLASDFAGSDTTLHGLLNEMTQHLLLARGQSSQAFPNGLRLMLAGAEDPFATDAPDLRARIRESVDRFVKEQAEDSARMTNAGVKLLTGARCVIAYDYSGSVADILARLADNEPAPEVVILESRALDGGKKFIRELAPTSLAMRFWPDAAMAAALKDVDAVLVGAETLTVEGGCYNTIGTALLALAAHHNGVPFYVVSTTIKVDLGTSGDPRRPIPARDLKPILAGSGEADIVGRVSMICPDLDYTPPSLVSGLITEAGCVSPPTIAALAAELAKKLDGRV